MNEQDMDQHIANIKLARQAILDDLKRRYQEGDRNVKPNTRGWRSLCGEEDQCTTNYFSGAGTMPCPVCQTGVLTYRRASLNGHVWARCSSNKCMCWMELTNI